MFAVPSPANTASLLHIAASQGNYELCVDCLSQALVQQGPTGDATLLVERDELWVIPLDYAVAGGHTNVCELLLNKMQDRTCLTQEIGQKALRLAKRYQRPDVAQLLKKRFTTLVPPTPQTAPQATSLPAPAEMLAEAQARQSQAQANLQQRKRLCKTKHKTLHE